MGSVQATQKWVALGNLYIIFTYLGTQKQPKTPKLQTGSNRIRMQDNIPPIIRHVYQVVTTRAAVCRSLELVQMFQPHKNDLFAGLFDLTRQEDLVQNCIDLYSMAKRLH